MNSWHLLSEIMSMKHEYEIELIPVFSGLFLKN